jgi:hypothetical protein
VIDSDVPDHCVGSLSLRFLSSAAAKFAVGKRRTLRLNFRKSSVHALLGKLGSMPYGNNPDCVSFNAVEETIWRYDHFSVGDLWELRNHSAGIRKVFQPAQDLFRTPTKAICCFAIISANVTQRGEKLDSRSGCEAYCHGVSSARSASASARIESRSWPAPASISLSPLAISCRISRSRSNRS